MEDLSGINLCQPPITVEHSKLTRVNPDSEFKSECPKCKKGIMPMSRDPFTRRLLEFDRCLLCGQEFIYTDIDKLRKLWW